MLSLILICSFLFSLPVLARHQEGLGLRPTHFLRGTYAASPVSTRLLLIQPPSDSLYDSYRINATETHPHHQNNNHHHSMHHNEGTHIHLVQFPPSIKKILINVGSNIDPPMPPEDDTSVGVIAVEPILATAQKIPYHDRLWVIVCAIADYSRFQPMYQYNIGGLSSSLSPIRDEEPKRVWWKTYYDMDPRKGRKSEEFRQADAKPEHEFQIVPVMSLRMLLNSIPPEIEIAYLHTDMQGYDFTAIKSAGKALTRVKTVQCECYMHSLGHISYNLTSSNSCEDDFEPHMKSLGYKANKTIDNGGGEADIFFTFSS